MGAATRKRPPERGYDRLRATRISRPIARCKEVEVNRETGRPRRVARARRSIAARWSIGRD